MSDVGQGALPQDLQFQHAEPLPAENPNARSCAVCKQAIGPTYFQAQAHVVCPMCAERIQSGQQKPPAIALGRAFLYGSGAALAGCILYAAVAILLNLEIGIVAVVVGVMVGKAIRAGCKGVGGRPQQIMAVVLTYFAISTSYIPVYFHELSKNPKILEQARQKAGEGSVEATDPALRRPRAVVTGIIIVIVLFAAAPFFNLVSGVGGLISLFITFIGLRQAWKLTARSEIPLTGPFETAPVP